MNAPELTGAQRRVLRRLLRGESSVEIAAALDCSKWTIRNHTKAVLAAHGVRSHPKLMAKLMRPAER